MFQITKRTIFIFLIAILISGCGYTAQYGKNNSQNFSINLINFSGDRDFNNAIKSKLNTYNKNSDKNFEIKFTSKYEKRITLKDSSGAAKEYELKISVNFNITHDGQEKDMKMIETFKMQKIDDGFEESNYERSIKNNFAENISQRLVNYLFQIK